MTGPHLLPAIRESFGIGDLCPKPHPRLPANALNPPPTFQQSCMQDLKASMGGRKAGWSGGPNQDGSTGELEGSKGEGRSR